MEGSRETEERSPLHGSALLQNSRERDMRAAAADAAAQMGKRYEMLGLADALTRPYDYPAACHELSVILRLAYSKLPKGVQSLVFCDTLSAFRRLPEEQTSYAMSSANLLLQAAEAVLPKQKKTLAVSEFKHAVIAQKRHCKAHQDGGSMQVPHDVLVHIFSFLDMRSLLTVNLVCWAWNSAASENVLWKSIYSLLFGKYDVCCKGKDQTHKLVQEKREIVLRQSTEDVDPMTSINWREAFKRKYIGNPIWRSTSNRASCGHCKSIIWLGNITGAGSHRCRKIESRGFKIRPVSSNEVVEYLFGEISETMSSDDSDGSDGDFDESLPSRQNRLWAFMTL